MRASDAVWDEAVKALNAANRAAAGAGCSCRPEIYLTVTGGVWSATVLHDDWCALLVAFGQGIGAN